MRKSDLDDHNANSKKDLSNDKGWTFFQSVLEELHKSGVDVSAVASFIQRGWEQEFHRSTWKSLLAEYNSLEREIMWRQAFQSNSDKLIVETWIIYGRPVELTDDQEKVLNSSISKFGALSQIKWSRKDKEDRKFTKIEHVLGPLLDGSDLVFQGSDKE